MRRSLVYVIVPLVAFCLFLLPGTASAQAVIPGVVSTQVTGTAGISTELVEIISGAVTTYQPVSATIDWGDGGQSQADLDCEPVLLKGTSCNYWGEHTYANAGAYTVTVTATIVLTGPLSGFTTTQTYKATAQIDGLGQGTFLIVSAGDSVASGEGNPDVPAKNSTVTVTYNHLAYWSVNTSGCSDQSRNAAPVLAANMLQKDNPGAQVAIDHVACSGATIGQTAGEIQGMDLPYGQQVDALVMTVGADSICCGGFSGILGKCLQLFHAVKGYDCAQDPTFQEELEDGTDNLYDPSTWFALHSTISEFSTGTDKYKFNPAKQQNPISDVYLTEYYDPTHDAKGNFPTQAESLLCTAPEVDNADMWPFLYNNVVVPLNQDVAYIANQYQVGSADLPFWHFVGGSEVNGTAEPNNSPDTSDIGSDNSGPDIGPTGDDPNSAKVPGVEGPLSLSPPFFPIASDFTYSIGAGHGYCAGSNSWVVSAEQSLAYQGNKNGTGHPNENGGQNEYATQIVNAINHYTPPETTATATSNNQPYTFGTWTAHDVYVTLNATNKLDSAGVKKTYYYDRPTCTTTDTQTCMVYQETGPFFVKAPGKHTIYFFSSNLSGVMEHVVNSVQVWIDGPPVMTCSATPSMLWPPNHKLVPVNLNVTSMSLAFGPLPSTLTSVTTSEGNPATDIQGFTIGTTSTQGLLRASRTGFQDAGRVYTFTYQSTDPLDLSSTCTITVTVPHDQGRR